MEKKWTIYALAFGAFWGMMACKSEPEQAAGEPQVAEETHRKINPTGNRVSTRFFAPPGYERVSVDSGSMGHHLRNTYLLPADAQVYYYDGKVKFQQNVYEAVIDWDITSNVMTGSDAVLWFHSEYMYKMGAYDKIEYPLHSGFMMEFDKWVQGQRSVMEDNAFRWEKRAEPDSNYFALRNFQEFTYAYADYKAVLHIVEKSSVEEIGFGTVLVSTDRWGHAVIVIDVAEDETGDRAFLLAQAFVPAQQMQILQNPAGGEHAPWYTVSQIDSVIKTPEWTFTTDEVYRFKELP